jgi:hypothetical protein
MWQFMRLGLFNISRKSAKIAKKTQPYTPELA